MQYVYVSPRVFSLLKSEGQNFQNISYSNKGHNKIGQNILLALKTISNGELSDPLCNSKNRGLTLVTVDCKSEAWLAKMRTCMVHAGYMFIDL